MINDLLVHRPSDPALDCCMRWSRWSSPTRYRPSSHVLTGRRRVRQGARHAPTSDVAAVPSTGLGLSLVDVARGPDSAPKTEDSTEQRRAERLILAAASEHFGKTLQPRKILKPEKGHVEIDGVADDDSVLAEVYAHQGDSKGSQPDKVMSDALKLL